MLDDPAELLTSFCRSLVPWATRWLEQGFEPIRRAWLQHAYGLGERIEIGLGDERLAGIFRELDGDGAMILELGGGDRRRITYGEIFAHGMGG